MFVTIWMCTHEWSLISSRTTALTFATCHQRLELLVGVDALEQLPELAVAARRHADPHAARPPRPASGASRARASSETGSVDSLLVFLCPGPREKRSFPDDG